VTLDYAGRCERYARQRGWAYDPERMSIGHLTPRQRRRALKKESSQGSRAAIRRIGAAIAAWQPDDDDYDDSGDERYCVTPGCDCCGDGDDG
jgi:hypothetical protein